MPSNIYGPDSKMSPNKLPRGQLREVGTREESDDFSLGNSRKEGAASEREPGAREMDKGDQMALSPRPARGPACPAHCPP